MAVYRFETVWMFDNRIEPVWDAIRQTGNWPEWWRGVISVSELRTGDKDGVGAIYHTIWKSRLPYRLEFDSEVLRVVQYREIEVRAFGELEGSGLWQFETKGREVIVRYDWRVSTKKRWMNVIAPVARPLFKWNHDVIMAWGEAGLRSHINDRQIL